jgi:hypothetical protein
LFYDSVVAKVIGVVSAAEYVIVVVFNIVVFLFSDDVTFINIIAVSSWSFGLYSLIILP